MNFLKKSIGWKGWLLIGVLMWAGGALWAFWSPLDGQALVSYGQGVMFIAAIAGAVKGIRNMGKNKTTTETTGPK